MSLGKRIERLEAAVQPSTPQVECWYTRDEVTYENRAGERLSRAELDERPCRLRRIYIGIDPQQVC